MSFITFASITWTGDNAAQVAAFLSDVRGYDGDLIFSDAHGALIVPRANGIGSAHVPRGWQISKVIGTEDGPSIADSIDIEPPERSE